MLVKAEQYKTEDDANKNCVEAKNGLENYCYSLKTSIGSDQVKAKLLAQDLSTLNIAI